MGLVSGKCGPVAAPPAQRISKVGCKVGEQPARSALHQ